MYGRLPILLFAMAVHATDALAEVQQSLNYTYYDVTLMARQSLLSALNVASPIRENSRIFHGYTRWNVHWHIRWQEHADGSCRTVSTKTDLTGDITLPRLARSDDARSAAFDRYTSALMRHETGHFDLGRRAARAVDQALSEMPPMKSCDALYKSAGDRAGQILDHFREEERQYDVTTGHGKTQGADADLLRGK